VKETRGTYDERAEKSSANKKKVIYH